MSKRELEPEKIKMIDRPQLFKIRVCICSQHAVSSRIFVLDSKREASLEGFDQETIHCYSTKVERLLLLLL